MIALLARRARAQWPLLACLLAVLVLGATLLGTCALLVTRTSERAVEVAASRAGPEDTQLTAYAVAVSAKNARSVATDTRNVLTSALAPFRTTTATRANSVMHVLPFATDADRSLLSEAYLSGVGDLSDRASLVAGRWPQAANDAALLETTARLLGLEIGSHVHLGPAVGPAPAPPLDVTVVGMVRPLPGTGWDRDPLGGAGFDPHPADARYASQVNAYGPFLVPLDTLLSSGSALDRVEVTARPDLSAPTGRDLDRLNTALLGVDRRLAGTLGRRVDFERISTPLPQTLTDARSQQELVAGSVLALALIGLLLTAIALALAGRLATGVRADESALLDALGLSGGQFALVAAVEATALAVLAAAGSIPASSALQAALTHLPPLGGAGLASRPVVTTAQVGAVCAGALALALLHVWLAVRPAPGRGDRRTRRELLARSGADLLLCGLAGAGWWQLRAQPAAAGSRADVVRVLAPALVLAACAALALRLLPRALRRAERLAGPARGLVLPLATFQAARRPQAFAAGLLIGLACAAATFGTAFGATWSTSQHDQADLAVGTDLAVGLSEPPAAGQSTAIHAAAGGTSSPVAVQNIVVGQWLGDPGVPPQLVALRTRDASGLLRGRGDDRWGRVAKALAPKGTVTGPALPRGATPIVSGTASGDVPIVVSPRLLLQDRTGLRTTCGGPAVPLDGRPHPVPGCAPVAGLRLVAVALPFTGPSGQQVVTDVDVTMSLSGGLPSPVAWTAEAASPESGQLATPNVSTAGARLRFGATVQFSNPADSTRVLVGTAFGDPGPVPIAVSTGFARDVHAHPGSKLSLTLAGTPVDAVVTQVVPTIPSVPGAPAALTDVDTLTRALVRHGDFDSPLTAWWVGNPRADAVSRVEALRLGQVRTRTGEAARLTGGPLRALLPAMLRVLVAAAVALLLGGVVLHVAYDVQLRALEVARLRGLGMSRRDIRAALLGEHAVVLLPLLAAGTVIGAGATRALAPLLIRSDTGAAPVPPTTTDWPWLTEAALLALLVVAGGLAVLAVVTVQARRADAAHLRMAS